MHAQVGAAEFNKHIAFLHMIAVADRHVFHHAVDLGENLAAVDRLQRTAGLHFEIPRHNHQGQDNGPHGQRYGNRFGQGSSMEDPTGIAQRPPDGHEEEILMLHGVGQGRGTVFGDHVDALQHSVGDAAVLDLLDDQGADGLLGHFRLIGVLLFFPQARPDKRQHGDRFRMRIVDVFLHGVLDLGCHVAGIAGVPDGVARLHDLGGQLAQEPHGVRSFVEEVLPADGLDAALPPTADGDADAVAFDQPASFVGDHVCRLSGVEAGVYQAGEILQL